MQTNKFNLWLKKCMGERMKKCIILFLHPQRNKFLLFNYTNRSKKNRVNLDYWLESDNLGDTLAPVIVNYMLSLRHISPEKPVSGRKHLYAVGSVLTAGIQDCTVWGSGVLNTVISYRLKTGNLISELYVAHLHRLYCKIMVIIVLQFMEILQYFFLKYIHPFLLKGNINTV